MDPKDEDARKAALADIENAGFNEKEVAAFEQLPAVEGRNGHPR